MRLCVPTTVTPRLAIKPRAVLFHATEEPASQNFTADADGEPLGGGDVLSEQALTATRVVAARASLATDVKVMLDISRFPLGSGLDGDPGFLAAPGQRAYTGRSTSSRPQTWLSVVLARADVPLGDVWQA